MSIILYGILLAHLTAYREQYTNIGITFAVTVMMKILARKIGDKDNADLIGIGGGALTVGEFAKLIKQVTTRGFNGGTAGTEATKGLLPELLESIKGLITK